MRSQARDSGPIRAARARWTLGLSLAALIALLGLSPTGALGGLAGPDDNNPNDLPEASCFWTGPFTRDDPKTNLAYPGTEITYWGAKFVTPPGAVLKLDGRFPHARYSSFNAYKDNGVSASSLSDTKIKPNKGSINPSIPGRNRLAKNRSFTIEVRGEAKPAVPAPNTLYAEPVAGKYQDILYRVYIPDKGKSLDGGTGLPEPSLQLGDGTVLTGQALCDALNSSHDYTNQLMPISTYNLFLQGKGPEFVATNPALPEFSFARYYNLPTSLARYGTIDDQVAAWQNNPTYVGTQYDNIDARYMTGAFAIPDFGETLALRGRLPTTPTTWNGNKTTKAGQLVEWDMCVIQSLVTTKTWKCVFDEQLPLLNRKREYVILVSKADQRPSNAVRKCGVYWLEADPDGDGAGRPNVGQLLTRNVLPARDFKQSSWDVPTPFPQDAAKTMGDFYPRGSYMSKQKFEDGGCPFKWKR